MAAGVRGAWRERLFAGGAAFMWENRERHVWRDGAARKEVASGAAAAVAEPRVSFMIRDAPSLGHLARDLTYLWAMMRFGLVDGLDQVVFTHPEARRVYDGSRLGRVHTDYLLPLAEAIIAGAARPPPAPAIVNADELHDGMVLGGTIGLMELGPTPFASVPFFGGLDGDGLREALYARLNVSSYPAVLPQRITLIVRRHSRSYRNSAEFEAWVATWAAGHGWALDVLDLGSDRGGAKTMAEQAAAFSSTGILIAMHGAACFNAVMLPRNAVVIEVVPTSMRWNLFRTLSHSVGVQHIQYYATEPVCTSGQINACDAAVDVAVFERTLEEAAERWHAFARSDRLFEFPPASMRSRTSC